MSATLGAMLSEVQPDWKIRVYERLGDVALESSNAWNNAGTGHSALCELNYMPEGPDGSVTAGKARAINEQFQVSRQFWASLVEAGLLPEPSTFIHSTPHMTFVHGKTTSSTFAAATKCSSGSHCSRGSNSPTPSKHSPSGFR